ncbi:MAG: TetR/AcrR family transcriptional regulator [Bacteroidota bacterium]|nr:TetR/AcrR family transcriptional regulator [Bacteroidota bacterium]
MNPTKEHITLTSFRLFLQKGYKEVTMSMLVKATGLSKGAFYYYFENKEQLFCEALNNLFFSIYPFNSELEINPDISFYDYMYKYINNIKKSGEKVRDYLGNDDHGMGYYRLMLDIANYATDFRKKIELENKHELNFWLKIVENGIKRGELRNDIDLKLLANHFQWLQDGIAINSIFSGTTEFLYQNLEKVFVQLYQLIKK